MLRTKNKPRFGVFFYAVKTGQKLSLTKPGCGWKEWADEAINRQLMQYSHSPDGDIMVHFIGGSQGLWSQLRGLAWAEVERVAKGEMLCSAIARSAGTEAIAFKSSNSVLPNWRQN